MKITVLAVLLATQSVIAQERLWIGLSDNRVILDAILQSVAGGSITVLKDGRVVNVPFREIEQVRVVRGGLITRGALVGASVGFAVGGAIGFLSSPEGDRNRRAVVSGLAMGVVGGIIGSVIESAPDGNEITDLRGKSDEAKREVFEEMLRSHQE